MTETALVLVALVALIAGLAAANVVSLVLFRSRRFVAALNAWCDWNSVQTEKERLRELRRATAPRWQR